jgi:hypothetical protein
MVLGLKVGGNGRQSAAPMKKPGVDQLPTGASLRGSVINVKGQGVSFVGWDFSGFVVDIQAGGVVDLINGCFTDLSSGYWGINVRNGGRCKEVSWCTFDGGARLNAGVAINGQNGVGVEWIHHNRFLNISNDAIKPTGSAYGEQVIENNYIGPPKQWPNAKANWSNSIVYAVGDVAMKVSDGSKYISKVNGNLNNPLSATAFWRRVSPHSDAMQWIGNTPGGVRIRWNYIDWRSTDYNSGVTSAIFPAPPGGSALTAQVYIYENIIDVTSTSSFTEYPRPFIVVGGGGGVAPEIYNNWIQERPGYIIMSPGSVAPLKWGDNWQLADDALIQITDSRLPNSGLVAMNTPALGIDLAG